MGVAHTLSMLQWGYEYFENNENRSPHKTKVCQNILHHFSRTNGATNAPASHSKQLPHIGRVRNTFINVVSNYFPKKKKSIFLSVHIPANSHYSNLMKCHVEPNHKCAWKRSRINYCWVAKEKGCFTRRDRRHRDSIVLNWMSELKPKREMAFWLYLIKKRRMERNRKKYLPWQYPVWHDCSCRPFFFCRVRHTPIHIHTLVRKKIVRNISISWAMSGMSHTINWISELLNWINRCIP